MARVGEAIIFSDKFFVWGIPLVQNGSIYVIDVHALFHPLSRFNNEF